MRGQRVKNELPFPRLAALACEDDPQFVSRITLGKEGQKAMSGAFGLMICRGSAFFSLFSACSTPPGFVLPFILSVPFQAVVEARPPDGFRVAFPQNVA